MNELATTGLDWEVTHWEETEKDEDPRDRLYEYIIDPEPFEDCRFDEGGEGD